MEKRWTQFICAVVSMIMIANLQYAWTLFVKPIQAAHKDWGLVGIQYAATLFLVFETWNRVAAYWIRSEEHTSELQSRLHLHFFPTRRSSDLTHSGRSQGLGARRNPVCGHTVPGF